MSLTSRKYFYQQTLADRNTELDYLTTTLNKMKLQTQEFYVIDASTAHRPDLISLKYYGNYDLGWLLCEHNNFQDPLTDFYIGRRVKIPTMIDYYQFFNRNSRKP